MRYTDDFIYYLDISVCKNDVDPQHTAGILKKSAVDTTSKVFRTLSITSVMSLNRFSVKPRDVTSVATPCYLTSGKTSLLSNVRLNAENMHHMAPV